MDVMELAAAERGELADLLDDLVPAEWEAPSLCAGWTVRDVVAHVFSYEDLRPPQLVTLFLRGRLNFTAVNALALAPSRAHSAEQLRDRARAHLKPRGLTAGFGGGIALADGMIHQQDIRRPLARSRVIPPERMVAALNVAIRAPTLGARRRIRGLRLVATDTPWEFGAGQEVSGPGETLLMVVAGRRAALAECSGPGVAELTRRLGSAPS